MRYKAVRAWGASGSPFWQAVRARGKAGAIPSGFRRCLPVHRVGPCSPMGGAPPSQPAPAQTSPHLDMHEPAFAL